MQARVQGGGGAHGAWPPPLENGKQKKKVIRENFKFHPYFANFLVEDKQALL